jgi:sulfur relay (sulfurtransferase) DsrC/TusE family protein
MSRSSSLSKVNEIQSKDPAKLVTINEKVNLTKKQYEVLKIICDTYEQSVSEYMEEALVEAMQYDIEEGNFSATLLEKLEEDDKKEDNSSSLIGSMNNDLENL